MNKRPFAIAALLAALSVGTTSNVFAQEKTRAEVRQELIQAENNGSRLVSDASYPDIAPIYQNQVAHQLPSGENSYGGAKMTTGAVGTRGTGSTPSSCVGPASFCNIYFALAT